MLFSYEFAESMRPSDRRSGDPQDQKPGPPGRRSFAKNAQDFGCGLPPSTALRVTPAMRLKFIDFPLGLRLHARNSR